MGWAGCRAQHAAQQHTLRALSAQFVDSLRVVRQAAVMHAWREAQDIAHKRPVHA